MNMLMNQLKTQNPQGYNEFLSLYNSGKNPNEILNNMLNSGRMNKSQLNQIKNYLNGLNGGNDSKNKNNRF